MRASSTVPSSGAPSPGSAPMTSGRLLVPMLVGPLIEATSVPLT